MRTNGRYNNINQSLYINIFLKQTKTNKQWYRIADQVQNKLKIITLSKI